MKSRKPTSLLLFNFSLILILTFIGILGTPIGRILAEGPTATIRPESIFITVTYIEPINVRSGPNSVYYPLVGILPIGASAPALGRSVTGEWIKIYFPEATDGSTVGWIYASLVTVSPGYLAIMEPPPTVMPSFFVTLNPAYVVSLQPESTSTRPATFTPPERIAIPSFTNSGKDNRIFSPGVLVFILAGLGTIGLLLTSMKKKS